MLIYIIGMMYSGKTTIGKHLSTKMGYAFVDTDEALSIRYGKSVAEIIKGDGIEQFRLLESDILRNIVLDINTVVSTGGGIILNEENVVFMRSNGVVIFLDVPLSELKNRWLNNMDRPLIKAESDLIKIYHERYELYNKSCEIRIECKGLNSLEIVDEIIKRLAK